MWILRKTVYGLCDAARAWYLRVQGEMESLSVKMCPLDNSLFMWYVNGHLKGIICIYVDDFLWAGTISFYDTIITKLKDKFLIGSSAYVTFTYVILGVQTYSDGLTVDQNAYIASLNTIPITKNRASNKKETLSDYEKKAYRALVGQLSWVTTHTRPDVAFEACALSVAFYNATIEDLIRLKRVVETLQRQHVNLFFPR